MVSLYEVISVIEIFFNLKKVYLGEEGIILFEGEVDCTF